MNTDTAHRDTFARDRLPPRDQWPVMLDSPDTRYPERMNAAVELLDAMIDRGHGDSIAVRGADITWSWHQLRERVDRIAHVMRGPMGLVAGNRVLLRGGNHPMMAACWLATLKAGLIAVATMPLLRASELIPIATKAQVNAVLCDLRLREEVERAAAECPLLARPMFFNDSRGTDDALETWLPRYPEPFAACDTAADDVALIAFTSGTTGQPKGTLHFHRDVIAMCDLFPRHVLKPRPDDIFCGTPPIAFTFGLGGVLCFPMRAGASTLLLEALSPEKMLAAIQQHRATVVFTAPTFYRQMAGLARNYDLSSLRACVSAGEALPDATRQLWKQATGIEMIDGIGSTEMIHIFISSAGSEVRQGSIGKVVPGYQAMIVDEQMKPLPPHTVGKLAVRGPTGCRYLDDPRQRQYVQQGWNLPGDTFLMDEDGYFFYQARSDDMIISAGYNIAGPEVEAALMTHPAVAECGVVGVPDAERGQIVRAYVVLYAGAIDQHGGESALTRVLQDHVKQAIAPYKYPRSIIFRDRLPRTETGKLQRFRLRAEAQADGPSAS
jgi:2-aminobenzoate-CoA ligase